MPSQEPQQQNQAQSSSDEQFLREHRDELPRATQRAKWVQEPDEREDYAGQTLATRSRAVIRQWAEQRKATPATAPGVTGAPGSPGAGATPGEEVERALRFDFPDAESGQLQAITWDEFFQIFDDQELVFLFQQHMTAGEVSDLCRFERPSSGGEA